MSKAETTNGRSGRSDGPMTSQNAVGDGAAPFTLCANCGAYPKQDNHAWCKKCEGVFGDGTTVADLEADLAKSFTTSDGHPISMIEDICDAFGKGVDQWDCDLPNPYRANGDLWAAYRYGKERGMEEDDKLSEGNA